MLTELAHAGIVEQHRGRLRVSPRFLDDAQAEAHHGAGHVDALRGALAKWMAPTSAAPALADFLDAHHQLGCLAPVLA